MHHLYFDYCMRIAYEMPVEKCYYTMKCIPKETNCQHKEWFMVETEPKNHQVFGEDSFGNAYFYGYIGKPHQQFTVHIKGEIKTGLSDGEEDKRESMLGLFRYPSCLTTPQKELSDYFVQQIAPLLEGQRSEDAYQKAVKIMHKLYQDFSYEKMITNIHTTAEEAWQIGKGVCQDYAHILIVLCRLAGIPARYVTGMMLGEGHTHAWAEIFSQDKWYGLDATNDKAVDYSYIKLGTGRDAKDCMINRGILFGGGSQIQEITVRVWEENT